MCGTLGYKRPYAALRALFHARGGVDRRSLLREESLWTGGDRDRQYGVESDAFEHVAPPLFERPGGRSGDPDA